MVELNLGVSSRSESRLTLTGQEGSTPTSETGAGRGTITSHETPDTLKKILPIHHLLVGLNHREQVTQPETDSNLSYLTGLILSSRPL